MSDDNSKSSGGIGIFTLLQIIFALCYYADPCRKTDKDCSTAIGNWSEWMVWLPTIISTGLGLIILILFFIRLCYDKKSQQQQFLTIDPMV